jgi:hypothetical protein
LQAAEEEVEEEDEVTGYSNGDMGLQARALYDYQAGKSLCGCRLSYMDIDSSFTILSNLVSNSVEQNVHQNTLHPTPQPCPHTQYQHNTDNLL